MDVSIVIPLKDDLRIEACINSIDEPVEVIISLNKASETIRGLIERLIRDNKSKALIIRTCEIPYPSIAAAYNNGIRHATYSRILLMDSDCIFEKGTIRKMMDNLNNHFLSKGKVVFTSNSWVTSVIARSREFHTSDRISAYSPPLLFIKDIKKHIGGYYFHPKLVWLEDSEFDRRVQSAHLEIVYDATATIYHPPLTPTRDLRSAFWYGVGHRIGFEIGINVRPRGIIRSFHKYAIGASIKKGVAVGIYLMLWKMVLLGGFYTQALFRLREK